jgi:hypothetical protein
MYATVTQVTINDADAATEGLRSELVPRVADSPGFVAGYWVRVGENQGMSVIVYESEDAARQAMERIEPPTDAVTVKSMDVGEVVASA